MKNILTILAVLLGTTAARAQEIKAEVKQSDTTKGKHAVSISLGSDETKDTSNKVFDLQVGMLDLGFNYLDDKTDYNSAAAQSFLNVDPSLKNKNLFSLRDAKSVNVNIYPILLKARLVKTKGQRLYVSLGAGLQIYNFRFNKPISYQNETVPQVVMDTVSFTKNKLTVTYLSVPLMVTSKTKLAKDIWLVYGVGITAGYRISSWTKQISGERGKEKDHDQFNLNNFNSCVTGEVGIDGWLRLYASYQLTALHENSLQQYPYAIGVRFIGI